MKVLYKQGLLYLIKINDNEFYYGNGESVNAFGTHPVQFLRFNPYMEYVEDEMIKIPSNVLRYIKSNQKENEEKIEKFIQKVEKLGWVGELANEARNICKLHNISFEDFNSVYKKSNYQKDT